MKNEGLRGQAIRYLVVGGVNTLATYIIFFGLGLFLEAWVAYTIAFLLGLAWVIFGSSRLVFRAAYSPSRLLTFTAFYVVIYGIGRIIVAWMNPSDAAALALTSIAILVVTTPLSFLGGRYIFTTPNNGTTKETDNDEEF